MSTGFRVDVAAVDKLAANVGEVAATIEELAKRVDQAEVPEDAWGLVGQFLLPSYRELRAQAGAGLLRSLDSLTELQDVLGQSAQAYEEADLDAVSALKNAANQPYEQRGLGS